MSTISGQITLSALKHVIMTKKGKTGDVTGIFIPIDVNNLYHGVEKGVVKMDIIAFDQNKPEYKQSHTIKQSLPKEVLEKLKAAEIKTPFIGKLNTAFGSANGAAPVANAAPAVVLGEDDDLPF